MGEDFSELKSEVAVGPEGVFARMSNDNMIMQDHADGLDGFLDLGSHRDVGVGGGRIA